MTGPEQTDVYDVWEPRGDDAARGITVALVHGGFWREQYDRAHQSPLAEALARDGFTIASLEYPRIGMPEGGWPGTGTSRWRGSSPCMPTPTFRTRSSSSATRRAATSRCGSPPGTGHPG